MVIWTGKNGGSVCVRVTGVSTEFLQAKLVYCGDPDVFLYNMDCQDWLYADGTRPVVQAVPELAVSVVPEVDPASERFGNHEGYEPDISVAEFERMTRVLEPVGDPPYDIPEEEEQPNDKQPPSSPLPTCTVCGEGGGFVVGDEERCPGHAYLPHGYKPSVCVEPPTQEQLQMVGRIVEQRLGVPVEVTYRPQPVTSFGVRTCQVEGCGAVLGEDVGPMCATHVRVWDGVKALPDPFDDEGLRNAASFFGEAFEDAWQALAEQSNLDPVTVALCKRLRDLEVRR